MYDKLYSHLADIDVDTTEFRCVCDMLNALSYAVEHEEMENRSIAGAINGTFFYLLHLVKELEDSISKAYDVAFAIKDKLAELGQS